VLALNFRRQVLQAAWQPSVPDREQLLVEACRGKRVLDIGCVDQVGVGFALGPLHRALSAAAATCTGLDINRDGVEELQQLGYDVRYADATSPTFIEEFDSRFDVIVAGEVIEHVLDLGQFFGNMRSCLAPGGRLFVTTPNPFSIGLALPNILGRGSDNVDHTVYHWPSGLAEIADRSQLRLVSYFGERRLVRKRFLPGYIAGLAASLVSSRGMPECRSVIYVFGE